MLLTIAAAVLKFQLAWVTFKGDSRGLLRVRVVTPPDVVRVSVSVYNGDYGRMSEQDVREGYSVMWFQWRDVPEGDYGVDGRARLTDGSIIQSPTLQVRVR